MLWITNLARGLGTVNTDANGSYKPRFERNILVPEWLSASHDRAMTAE